MKTPKAAPGGAQVITLPVALKFIGHGTVEAMLTEFHPSTRPTIRVMKTVEDRAAGINGMRSHECKIMVQVAGIDEVHYVNIVAGRFTTMNGQVFGPDTVERDFAGENQDQAEAIIINWIKAQGYTDVRSGLISTPADYKVLSGWADCITLEKTEERRRRIIATDPAPVLKWIEAQGDDDGFISVDDMAARLGLRRRDTGGGVEYSGQNPFDPDGDQYSGFILYGAGTDKPGWAYDSKLKKEYTPEDLAELSGVSKVAYTVPLMETGIFKPIPPMPADQ